MILRARKWQTAQPDRMPDQVVVFGKSGAGRSTALRALQDEGFATIDPVPVAMFSRLQQAFRAGQTDRRPLAFGLQVLDEADQDGVRALRSLPGPERGLWVFLDCRNNRLETRYRLTRRLHPLGLRGVAGSLAEAIAREGTLLEPLHDAADWIIDTSDLSERDLAAWIARTFGRGDRRLEIQLRSFSWQSGIPTDADFVYDMRFLDNPHYDPQLRALSGLDPAIQAFLQRDANLAPFLGHLEGMLSVLLPRLQEEARGYLTLAFGCTGGKHRSVATAELLHRFLVGQGWPASCHHRNLPASPSADPEPRTPPQP